VDTLLARCHHEFNYLGARVRWYGACSTPDAITHITESIMRKVVVLTVSFIGGLCAAHGAHAEEQSGFYLGGSVGQASNESGRFKGSDFAFKVSGGYALTTSRLGSASERETANGEDFACGIGMELAISGGLKFRAEYELVDVSEGDFQIVSAGAVYKF
jgi:opacity protein-like surface antigen